MYKNRRQNSRSMRTEKLYAEINRLILECYRNDDMRNLEKIIVNLHDSSARAEILLTEIEASNSVREFCEFCDYCR